MRYLIDTNVFIRIDDDYDIADNIKTIFEDYENIIYTSSESIKEYIHPVQIGRLVPRKNISGLDIFNFIENILGFTVKYVAKSHGSGL